MRKKIIKFLLILVFIFPVLLFLNTGFNANPKVILFQTIAFSILFCLSLIWSFLKKYFLFLSGLLLIIMSALSIFGKLAIAELFGSSGYGLLLLLLIAYLPQVIKKGYIEKI